MKAAQKGEFSQYFSIGCYKCPSFLQVLTSTLHIPRGGNGEVEFQFTIPFVSRHNIIPGQNIEDQTSLYINMGVHGGSVECDDPNKKLCDVSVNAYKIDESDKYDTDDWKVKHKIKVYNRDDGDFTLIDKHLTLRFETGTTDGVGSKIFEDLTLPDIQVFPRKHTTLLGYVIYELKTFYARFVKR